MRTIYRTEEFYKFLEEANTKLKSKIEYVNQILITQKIINSKIAKKLINTDLYELRIKSGNEYRILTFTIDSDDINQCENILFISGFQKKSTKDYDKEIKKAFKILEQWTEES
ncbi:type II toxin-antitoxin system RelE/ParE family toxin [Weeksellaceae bacterium TAE3-ERU29]|nr:type II toxin-antitoxin system RelE/ParE family toxin [Weeksellaceae bacterium TAE3-ERU29]